MNGWIFHCGFVCSGRWIEKNKMRLLVMRSGRRTCWWRARCVDYRYNNCISRDSLVRYWYPHGVAMLSLSCYFISPTLHGHGWVFFTAGGVLFPSLASLSLPFVSTNPFPVSSLCHFLTINRHFLLVFFSVRPSIRSREIQIFDHIIRNLYLPNIER